MICILSIHEDSHLGRLPAADRADDSWGLTGDSRGIRGDEIDDGWLSQESSLASGRVAPLVTTLEEALAQSRGRISGPTVAAAKLGIPRQTLDRKILSLGIDKNQFNSH
jgi:DNA-binding NtrC family response regulator